MKPPCRPSVLWLALFVWALPPISSRANAENEGNRDIKNQIQREIYQCKGHSGCIEAVARKYANHKGRALMNAGSYHLAYENFDTALVYFKRVLALPQDDGRQTLLGQTHCLMAEAFNGLGHFEKAMYHAQQAFDFYKTTGENRHIWKAHFARAMTYRAIHDTVRALHDLSSAFQILKSSPEGNEMDVGFVRYYLLQWLAEASGQENHYLQLLDETFSQMLQNPKLQDNHHFDLFGFDEPQRGIEILKSKIPLLENEPWRPFHTMAYRTLGDYYRQVNDPIPARENFEKALGLAQKKNQVYLLEGTYGRLYEVNKALQNFGDALYFLEAQKKLQDSLKSEERIEAVYEMEEKYRTALKDVEIADQRLALEKKNRWQWGLAAAFLLTLMVGTPYLWHLKRRKRLEAQLRESENKAWENRNKLDRIQALVEGQENERNRLARELHDGLGGMITALKTSLQQHDQNGRPMELVQKTYEEVRRISHDLSPQILEQEGLVAALEELKNTMQKNGLGCRLVIKNLPALPMMVQLQLYRTVQEACNNILKHAHANECFIQIIGHDDALNFLVEDNGYGIPSSTIKGNGLKNMAQRTEIMGGNLHIDSVPGKGTTLTGTLKIVLKTP